MTDAGFAIAASGLEADRTAMDTIADNLSNVNTPGYAAESPLLTTTPSWDALGIGAGVTVLDVGQANDAVLSADNLAAAGGRRQQLGPPADTFVGSVDLSRTGAERALGPALDLLVLVGRHRHQPLGDGAAHRGHRPGAEHRQHAQPGHDASSPRRRPTP